MFTYGPDFSQKIKHQITVKRSKVHHRGAKQGDVERIEVCNIIGLNLVVYGELVGGVSRI